MLKKQTLLLALATLLTMSLHAQFTIMGTVFDTDNVPFPFADITLEPSGINTRANFDGLYSIKDVKPGRYTITASCSTCISQTKTVVIEDDATANFTLGIDPNNDSPTETGIPVIRTPYVSPYDTLKAHELNEVVVSGVRVQKNAPFTVTNIKKLELNEFSKTGQELPFLFAKTPGPMRVLGQHEQLWLIAGFHTNPTRRRHFHQRRWCLRRHGGLVVGNAFLRAECRNHRLLRLVQHP